jgi:antitoxin (DNA-binding transcriptional repressor) of toxin-antitoxin stability system
MTAININEIQRDPLSYLRRVEAGEAFLVMRDEQPVAEIKPVPSRSLEPRPFGRNRGEFTVPVGFDNPLPEEVLQDFERE